MHPPVRSGRTEAVVLIKAAPQAGQRHGETVCCAGIDLYGSWLRLYPVSFRLLEDRKKFGRWDRIRFNWRLPNDDTRPESRRVDQDSIEIIKKISQLERQSFLAKSIVTSLVRERELGRSLALLRPEILEFVVEKKSDEVLVSEKARFRALRDQSDMFAKKATPYQPCPFNFRYRYKTDDGERFGTCQDWETEATYFRWAQMYGEQQAIYRMHKVFGEEYPRNGVVFAMGTHSQHPNTWLINGVITLPVISQSSFI